MKKRLMQILSVVLILAALGLGGKAVWEYFQEELAGNQYVKMKNQLAPDTAKVISKVIQDDLSMENMKEEEDILITRDPNLVIPVDFESLQEKYPDVYSWITVPGTKIDYPVAQKAGDNAYYLNHSLDGTKKIEGAIYTEDYNNKEFSDPLTVIYGHNMRNGSMFQNLHFYEDRDFFEKHQEVLVYLPEQILHYQIFAAYVYDDRHLLFSFDTQEEDAFVSYLNSVLGLKSMKNNIDDSVELDEKSKILTLSTCNSNPKERFLVQAVLVAMETKS